MLEAFDHIQQPRTPFALQNMVVWARFTDEQAYAQCVLEMSIAYDNLRLANINMTRKQMDIDDIKKKGKLSERDKLDIAEKEIELEQTQRAVLWAEREFTYLFNLWNKRPKKYTRDELNQAQPLEYKRKLETQAKQDLIALGRVSQSNCEWLRQIGIDPIVFTQEVLPTLWQPQPAIRDEVESKYLEEGKLRCLCIIPSEHRLTAQQVDDLIWDIDLPTNIEFRFENISESPVADNYNIWFEKAIKEWCTHILTLEDDQVLDKDSIIKLFDFALDNPDACVWAWYPKRQKTRQWVHIKLSWWHRRFLDDDNNIHELKTMAMWLSIYPTYILNQIDFPRCKTTESLSQDSYLSQKIRDKWYKLLCDTKIKIWHKDRDWEVYY